MERSGHGPRPVVGRLPLTALSRTLLERSCARGDDRQKLRVSQLSSRGVSLAWTTNKQGLNYAAVPSVVSDSLTRLSRPARPQAQVP